MNELKIEGVEQTEAFVIDQKEALKFVTEIEDRIIMYMKSSLDHCVNVDSRWLAIATTDIEKGFMACKRAIFGGKRASVQLDK